MKKTFFTITLMLISLIAYSQQRERLSTVNPIYEEYLPLNGSTITFSDVVQVDGSSSSDIYIKSNEWLVKTFNSAKDVIQFQDKEAGKMICKTFETFTVGKGWNRITMDLSFLLTIEARDGRYKISASDFIHEYETGFGAAKIQGSNPLEAYYMLKHPTKKEESSNIEMAKVIGNHIALLFLSAQNYILANNEDDW